MILHHIDTAGGLTAGDTDTGVTAYAAPKTHYAIRAAVDAPRAAQGMVRAEGESRYRGLPEVVGAADARNWAALRAGE